MDSFLANPRVLAVSAGVLLILVPLVLGLVRSIKVKGHEAELRQTEGVRIAAAFAMFTAILIGAVAIFWALFSTVGSIRLESTGGIPVGTIIAFAGPNDEIEDGWLPCDGRFLRKGHDNGKYDRLIRVIKDRWGNGKDEDPDTVNVPDLRGMFLRGADGDKRSDIFKDFGPRVRVDGITVVSPFSVGTWQTQSAAAGTFKTTGLTRVEGGGLTLLEHMDASSVETRPKNAAVNWIIKY